MPNIVLLDREKETIFATEFSSPAERTILAYGMIIIPFFFVFPPAMLWRHFLIHSYARGIIMDKHHRAWVVGGRL